MGEGNAGGGGHQASPGLFQSRGPPEVLSPSRLAKPTRPPAAPTANPPPPVSPAPSPPIPSRETISYLRRVIELRAGPSGPTRRVPPGCAEATGRGRPSGWTRSRPPRHKPSRDRTAARRSRLPSRASVLEPRTPARAARKGAGVGRRTRGGIPSPVTGPVGRSVRTDVVRERLASQGAGPAWAFTRSLPRTQDAFQRARPPAHAP